MLLAEADTATTLTISGPLLLAAAVAVAAGAVSFASPCVVPLVPGYLAYLAGLVGAQPPAVTPEEVRRQGGPGGGPGGGPDGGRSPGAGPDGGRSPGSGTRSATDPGAAVSSQERTDRWKVAGAAALFVAGFTVVFGTVLVGVVSLADALTRNETLLQRAGGVLMIVMGLAFVGLVPMLSRERRLHLVPRAGLLGAPLLGAVFGLGWVPCIGPTLAGVVAVAAGTGGGSLRAVVLTLAYCAGLGLPFVLLALGASRAVRALGWLRRHVRGVQVGGGVLLVAVGVLLVTGVWGSIVAALQTSIAGYTPPI